MVQIIESKPVADVVQITQSTAIRWPTQDQWPTALQFQQLGTLVKIKYPELTAGIDRVPEFRTAFLFLLFAGRKSKPDSTRSMSYWTQCAHDFFDRHSLVARTNADALVAAAIVHGIPWTGPAHATIGINLGESGEPLPSAYKKILECGQLPDPVPGRPLDHSIGTAQRFSVCPVG
jgi:hypothetical protein